MSYYRQQLETWLSELEVKGNIVLDIGGHQGPVKGRTKTWDVKDYKILDLPHYDIDIIAGHKTKPTRDYYDKSDVIFCLEVMEYTIKPFVGLRNIYDNLRKGGSAYITFAFVYPHHEELELDSLRYTETGVRRLADAVGLRVKNIWYRTDKSGYLQGLYSADGMHPSKNYAHHDATGFIVELTK